LMDGYSSWLQLDGIPIGLCSGMAFCSFRGGSEAMMSF
jgi:hypothetical protein